MPVALVDSHCHLDRLDLREFAGDLGALLADVRAAGVVHMLCVGISLEALPAMLDIVMARNDVSASVGVHPNERDCEEPDEERLLRESTRPQIVAIGETGLDYFRSRGDVDWQRERFRVHVRAARACGKPLIVHTRDAMDDTLTILEQEGAADVGGVMHCFTGDVAAARRALDCNFHISFSGIVTFPNAEEIQAAAAYVPEDRLLVETDSPYLAPVPHRGKSNRPAWVRHVAERVAQLRGVNVERVARFTTGNFMRLFRVPVAGT